MNMLNALLNLEVPIGRAYYFANVIALVGFAAGLIAFIFKMMGGSHAFFPFAIFLSIVVAAFTMASLIMLTVKRLRDMGRPGILSILLIIPGVNLLLFLFASLVKGTSAHSN